MEALPVSLSCRPRSMAIGFVYDLEVEQQRSQQQPIYPEKCSRGFHKRPDRQKDQYSACLNNQVFMGCWKKV